MLSNGFFSYLCKKVLKMENIKELREKMNELRQTKDVVFENEKSFTSLFGEVKRLVQEKPNDYELGKEVRNIYFSEN